MSWVRSPIATEIEDSVLRKYENLSVAEVARELERATISTELARVPMRGHPLSILPVRLVGERMHTARINPSIVEIEQGTHRDCIVNRFIGPAHIVQRPHIIRRDLWRTTIHPIDKPKQAFVFLVQLRALQVA